MAMTDPGSHQTPSGDAVSPSRIRLEASSFCQLRCPSCPTASGHIKPVVGGGFLRFDDFRKLVDANPQIERIELSNYGEALLNPDLRRILEYGNRKGVALSIANGLNLNHARDDILEAFVTERVTDITCSIDGASPETYRVYRVRGDFDRVIGNIEKINAFKRKHGADLPRLRWQFIVFGHNEHEIPAARAMAARLGMSFGTKISWDADLSPIRDPDYVRRETGAKAVTRAEHEAIHGRKYIDSICQQLWSAPQINWNGANLGCCRNFWGEFGGNAFADGLVETLNGERMRYARAMLQGEVAPRDDVPCTTCEMYQFMRANGRFFTPQR